MVEVDPIATKLPAMAQPARRVVVPDEPLVDPDAIDRAYHYHRARRNARLRQKRERARANLRFAIAMSLLVAIALGLLFLIWHTVRTVFGL
jgi:hypothetical protein